MPIWCGNKLFGLWDGNCSSQRRIHVFCITPQPYVEVVGQITVADVIVVRRIRGNHYPKRQSDLLSIVLLQFTGIARSKFDYCLCNPVESTPEIACAFTEKIAFRKVPSHWDCLASKCEANEAAACPCCNTATCISEAVNRERQIHAHRLGIGFSSPVMKSLIDQSVSGATMITSIAGLPSMFATMAIARAASN